MPAKETEGPITSQILGEFDIKTGEFIPSEYLSSLSEEEQRLQLIWIKNACNLKEIKIKELG